MLRTLPLLAVTGALTVLSGYVHGLYTGRWGDPAELEAAVARLGHVPMKIGDWHGEAETVDPRAARQAGFRDYVMRRYQNRRTGAVATVLLACGPPGPLSVHTPDICYRGAGFTQLAPAARYSPGAAQRSPADAFWTAKFGKGTEFVSTQQRIFWAWSTGERWQAPDNPRRTFAGAPALYKLYVTSQVARPGEEPAASHGSELMRELLPELQKALFSKT